MVVRFLFRCRSVATVVQKASGLCPGSSCRPVIPMATHGRAELHCSTRGQNLFFGSQLCLASPPLPSVGPDFCCVCVSVAAFDFFQCIIRNCGREQNGLINFISRIRELSEALWSLDVNMLSKSLPIHPKKKNHPPACQKYILTMIVARVLLLNTWATLVLNEDPVKPQRLFSVIHTHPHPCDRLWLYRRACYRQGGLIGQSLVE